MLTPLIATALLSIAANALPQNAATWAQCGGQGYSGPTTCPAGYSCKVINQWYSQCGADSAGGSSPPAATTPAAPAPAPTSGTTPGGSTGGSTGSTGNYRYLGRVNPATNELTWPGSGIIFSFTGTSASVPIKSVSGSASYVYSIDGGADVVVNAATAGTVTTPQLSNGKHTFEMRKKSEYVIGSIFIGAPTTTGTFNTPPTASKRIEIIGDSITVGYGLDGTDPCQNSAATEDAVLTYGALTAEAIGAEYSIVAWSGKGVSRNIATGQTDTSPLVPELWTRAGAGDADNTYSFADPVDYVVINLGTNDFSYLGFSATGSYKARDPIDASVYQSAITKFAQTVMAKYPSAQIYLLSSPMLSDFYPSAADAQKTTQEKALKAAVATLGSKAHFVSIPTQGSDVGCDYHPNAATHRSMAALLTAAIKGS